VGSFSCPPTLACWSLPHKGYKGDGGASVRASLLHDFRLAAAYIDFGTYDSSCIRSDHAFDAVVAAVVARASFLGLTALPEANDRSVADEEGWIHLPTAPLPGIRPAESHE
jgi:hypothetical protein